MNYQYLFSSLHSSQYFLSEIFPLFSRLNSKTVLDAIRRFHQVFYLETIFVTLCHFASWVTPPFSLVEQLGRSHTVERPFWETYTAMVEIPTPPIRSFNDLLGHYLKRYCYPRFCQFSSHWIQKCFPRYPFRSSHRPSVKFWQLDPGSGKCAVPFFSSWATSA